MVGRANNSWLIGGAVALGGHAMAVTGVLLLAAMPPHERIEDPVVLVELPAIEELASAPAPAQPQSEAEPTPPQDFAEPEPVAVPAPEVAAPLPREFVTTPPRRETPRPEQRPQPRPEPRLAQAPSRPAPAAPSVAPATNAAPAESAATSAKAQKEQADYFAQLSAHLNRKKKYPSEAKKAREQGIVTVRFTVHRDGAISNVSIKSSSGFALLDSATLDLMQRVAPLPKFPKTMTKDSVTLSLPIDYSLRTS